MYFAIYIMRQGAELMPGEKSHIIQLITDFFYYQRCGCEFLWKVYFFFNFDTKPRVTNNIYQQNERKFRFYTMRPI